MRLQHFLERFLEMNVSFPSFHPFTNCDNNGYSGYNYSVNPPFSDLPTPTHLITRNPTNEEQLPYFQKNIVNFNQEKEQQVPLYNGSSVLPGQDIRNTFPGTACNTDATSTLEEVSPPRKNPQQKKRSFKVIQDCNESPGHRKKLKPGSEGSQTPSDHSVMIGDVKISLNPDEYQKMGKVTDIPCKSVFLTNSMKKVLKKYVPRKRQPISREEEIKNFYIKIIKALLQDEPGKPLFYGGRAFKRIINVFAARGSRQKKSDHISDLEKKIKELVQRNCKLEEQNKKLKRENQGLKNILNTDIIPLQIEESVTREKNSNNPVKNKLFPPK